MAVQPLGQTFSKSFSSFAYIFRAGLVAAPSKFL